MKPFIFLLSFILFLGSCSKEDLKIVNEPSLPSTPYNYFSDDNEATLGRVLFYDKTLSINKSVSCGSCHKQQFAFADDQVFTTGVNITPTLRNSMALSNLGQTNRYFWDQRENNLSDLIFSPITNHIEMGIQDVDDLVNRIGQISYYPPLFNKAFGTNDVSKEKIESALSKFLVSLRSKNSKFDAFQQSHSDFSIQEELGRQLFMGRAQCSSCHSGSNLGGNLGANIGLDMNYADQGAGSLVSNSSLNGTFKTPSLRNIALTSPYMHDGRFETLEEVINHYNTGIQAHPNLNWRLTTSNIDVSGGGWWGPGPEPANGGTPISLNLNEFEQEALVAFLKTLTDPSFCNDVRYSNPFKQ